MATSRHAPPKFETVLYEKKGPFCFITLNRPEKLNAATDQLVEEVNDALFEFDADPELQVAILSGAGRAFCSGADVQQRLHLTDDFRESAAAFVEKRKPAFKGR
jgi:enoyl-CoA hydratase